MQYRPKCKEISLLGAINLFIYRKSVVMLIDRLDMTIDVDWDVNL